MPSPDDEGTLLEKLKQQAEPGVLDGLADEWLKDKLLDAVAFILALVPSARRRLRTGRLGWRAFATVVCDVVLRIVRNPEGVQSEGDGTYQYTLRSTTASGDMWLKDDEKKLLAGASSSTVGTIAMGLDRGYGR